MKKISLIALSLLFFILFAACKVNQKANITDDSNKENVEYVDEEMQVENDEGISIVEHVQLEKSELVELYTSFCELYAPAWNYRFLYDDNISTWEVVPLDVPVFLEFSESGMIITSEMMNSLEIKSFMLKIDNRELYIVSYNLSGFMTESELRIAERKDGALVGDLSQKFVKSFNNSDFGINYTQNVFEKFPGIFVPKYEINQTGIKVSLIVNPPFGNKEAEGVINTIEDYDVVIEYTFEKFFK